MLKSSSNQSLKDASMEFGTKLNYFKNFMNKLSNNSPGQSWSYTCSYHYIAGLNILVVWRCGEMRELDSGWMHLCLIPAQPSPAQPQWMSGSVVGLGSWTAGDCWAGNEYTTGTVASTSHPHYWSCRSSSISHQLGLAIFTLEIPE